MTFGLTFRCGIGIKLANVSDFIMYCSSIFLNIFSIEASNQYGVWNLENPIIISIVLTGR